MKIKYPVLILSIFLFSTTTLMAAGTSAEELVTQAASDDRSAAMSAVSALRVMGPVGLDALFVKYAADIERFSKTGEADENWRRVANALDAVAMQKDAYASHL